MPRLRWAPIFIGKIWPKCFWLRRWGSGAMFGGNRALVNPNDLQTFPGGEVDPMKAGTACPRPSKTARPAQLGAWKVRYETLTT